MRLKSRRCCVKSKAALLVLCSSRNLLVIVLVGYILEYGSILATVTDYFLLHNNELQTLAPAFSWLSSASLSLLPSGWMPG